DGSCMAFFDLGDNETSLPSPNTPAWVNHIALEVGSLEEVIEARKRLEAAGVEVLGITDHEIVKSIYFFDPNGFRVELTVPTVPQSVMDAHAEAAHGELERWTGEKNDRAEKE
ncbi:MAG TPA: VOC family protein, partial [Gammaproteobacteria bacterium]|nr:VOC family protein [Gammaproteobacteria bacterium]